MQPQSITTDIPVQSPPKRRRRTSEKTPVGVTIYSLTDPRSGEVFYIGQTSKKLGRRLTSHISDARRGARQKRYSTREPYRHWSPIHARVRDILEAGLEPNITALASVDAHTADEVEGTWIAWHRARGCTLTNCHTARGHQIKLAGKHDRHDIAMLPEIYQLGVSVAAARGVSLAVLISDLIRRAARDADFQ